MLTKASSAVARLKIAILLPLAVVGFSCFSVSCFAQEKTGKKDEIFKLDELPIAGYDLDEYLTNNLKYPKIARRKKVEGKVMVRFVVDEYGCITDPEVVGGIGGGCDEEALRVVKKMPPWKPAMDKGKPVKAAYILHIEFPPKLIIVMCVI